MERVKEKNSGKVTMRRKRIKNERKLKKRRNSKKNFAENTGDNLEVEARQRSRR